MPTGIIENWCIWIAPADEAWRDEYEKQRPGEWAALVTGQIIEDSRLRWPPGTAMRSSALVGFDFQNMQCITQNSVYLLRGPGLIATGVPNDYAQAVGQTMLQLAHIHRSPAPADQQVARTEPTRH